MEDEIVTADIRMRKIHLVCSGCGADTARNFLGVYYCADRCINLYEAVCWAFTAKEEDA